MGKGKELGFWEKWGYNLGVATRENFFVFGKKAVAGLVPRQNALVGCFDVAEFERVVVEGLSVTFGRDLADVVPTWQTT